MAVRCGGVFAEWYSRFDLSDMHSSSRNRHIIILVRLRWLSRDWHRLVTAKDCLEGSVAPSRLKHD